MKRAILAAALVLSACTTGTATRFDPASGESTCTTRVGAATIIGAKVPGAPSAYSLTVIERYGLYPGRTVNAAMRGQRWAGTERIRIDADLRNALIRGGRLDLSWSPWPYGGRQTATVTVEPYAATEALSCVGG